MDLNAKTALLLGAARPIGRAIARTLADQGMRLVLPWYDWPESVAELQEEFGAGGRHLLLRTDLRREEEVADLCRRIGRECGALDVLVSNIERGGMPIVHGAYTHPVNRGQWQREQDSTVQAKWLVWQYGLPLLQRAPEAAVVIVSSIAGLTGRSGPVGLLFSDGYSAANAAIGVLTRQWAREGAPSIRVNELMLGLIDGRHGPGTRGWQALDDRQREALCGHILQGRTGRPEEVAGAVLFLIRDAHYCTGAVLRMDGGYLLGGEGPAAMPPGILS